MAKYHKAWLNIIAVCILSAWSCKLDKVPPSLGNNINDDDTVLGITVIAKKIYNSYLTSSWKVSMTVLEYYDEDNKVVSGQIVANLFSGVKINDNLQTLSFINIAPNNSAMSGEYELSTNENVLFMKLPEDIFSRSENSPIRITRLNAGSMAWVALDKATMVLNGKIVHKAYRIIFFK